MNSKSDWLQKIGEYQNKLEEYQKVVFCEEKLWFFGQKCNFYLKNNKPFFNFPKILNGQIIIGGIM